MSNTFDLFVIGAGVAGMTAAEEAARHGLSVCLAEQLMFGGLAVNVNHLHPVPEGLPTAGSDLAADMMTRVSDLGVTTLFEPVTGLERLADGLVRVVTPNDSHASRCVVIASGAYLRKLGVPGEAELENRGVSHCADCDAPMLKGQTVMVVGGGDSALQEALVLTEFCPVVHLVHRGSVLSARAEFVEAVQRAQQIKVHMLTVVEALEGPDDLTAVRLRNLVTGQTDREPCSAFFSYIGLEPNTSFLPSSVETEAGYVQVNDRLETSLENVFAIGAVRSGYGGELVHAIADARSVAASACERLGRTWRE